MKKIPVLLIFVCISFFANSSLAYSQMIFLKLDGIDGESTFKNHENEIVVLSFQWQMSVSNPMLEGGTRSGRPIIRPVIIKKYIDKASPPIAIVLLNGNIIPEAILTVSKAGQDSIDYAQIKMWDVQVVNLSTENDLTGVLESVALSFSKVCYGYTPQKADGSSDATIERCWDIAANSEI